MFVLRVFSTGKTDGEDFDVYIDEAGNSAKPPADYEIQPTPGASPAAIAAQTYTAGSYNGVDVTIENTGAKALTGIGAALSGSDGASFEVTPTTTDAAAGASVVFTVTPKDGLPAVSSGGVAAKTYEAILDITNASAAALAIPVTFTVNPVAQPAPGNLTTAACTTEANKDGKIGGLDSSKIYQYKLATAAATAYQDVSGQTEITDLTAGAYDVRLKEVAADYKAASPATQVTVEGFYSFTGDTVSNLTVGQPYSLDLTTKVNGGKGGKSYAKVSGDLPPGLTFDPEAKTISGTPTAATTGSFTIRLKVTDTVNGAKEADFVFNGVAAGTQTTSGALALSKTDPVYGADQTLTVTGKMNASTATGDPSRKDVFKISAAGGEAAIDEASGVVTLKKPGTFTVWMESTADNYKTEKSNEVSVTFAKETPTISTGDLVVDEGHKITLVKVNGTTGFDITQKFTALKQGTTAAGIATVSALTPGSGAQLRLTGNQLTWADAVASDGSFTVKIPGNDYYKEVTQTYTVDIIEGELTKVQTAPTTDAVPYHAGMTLGSIQLKPGVVVDNATGETEVKGTWKWVNGAQTVDCTNSNTSYAAVFTPAPADEQTSNVTYAPPVNPMVTIVINKAEQTVAPVVSASALRVKVGAALTLNPSTAGIGSPTYDVDNTTIATVSGTTLTGSKAGIVNVTVTYDGGANYMPSTSAPLQITVFDVPDQPVVNAAAAAGQVTVNYTAANNNAPVTQYTVTLDAGVPYYTGTTTTTTTYAIKFTSGGAVETVTSTSALLFDSVTSSGGWIYTAPDGTTYGGVSTGSSVETTKDTTTAALTVTKGAAELSHIFTNLIDGNTYTFSVTATNEAGASAAGTASAKAGAQNNNNNNHHSGGGGGGGSTTTTTTTTEVEKPLTLNGSTTISSSDLQKASSLTLKNSQITIELDKKAVAKLNSDSSLIVKTEKQDNAKLSEEAKALVGNSPVFDVTAIQNGKEVKDFGNGTIRIIIAYTPKDGEDVDKLGLYYIDEDGNAQRVSGSKYDATLKAVVGETNHLSLYAVGYDENRKTEPEKTFRDVRTSDWFYEAVMDLVNKGVLSGRNATTFAPQDNVTRAEFATILAKAAGADLSKYTTSVFNDVKAGDWYLGAVAWANEAGVASGTGNGNFSPNANITRQDMAVMITKYVNSVAKKTLEAKNAEVVFADAAQIASYAKDAVKTMQTAGVISGVPAAGGGYSFNATANATRAEAASMISGLLKSIR